MAGQTGGVLLAFVVLLTLLLGGALFVLGYQLGRLRGPSLVGKTVVVHTKDQLTIRGVLHGQYTDRLTIRDAMAVGRGGSQTPLGGLEHIPVANVSFLQEIEAPVPA